MFNRLSKFVGLLPLMMCIFVVGCGGPSVGQIGGKITMNGQPVEGADVKLTSTTNPQYEFFGRSSAGGTYAVTYRQFTGLPVGAYTVTITHTVQKDGKPIPGGEQGAIIKNDAEKIETKTYTFDAEIVAGANSLDFDLSKSKK